MLASVVVLVGNKGTNKYHKRKHATLTATHSFTTTTDGTRFDNNHSSISSPVSDAIMQLQTQDDNDEAFLFMSEYLRHSGAPRFKPRNPLYWARAGARLQPVSTTIYFLLRFDVQRTNRETLLTGGWKKHRLNHDVYWWMWNQSPLSTVFLAVVQVRGREWLPKASTYGAHGNLHLLPQSVQT